MEKKPQTNGSPLFTFFQFKFGEIVSLIRVIRTIFMIGIIVAVFAFTFTFILYCLYKYFIPGLFILAGGMIFLPLLVYLFRRLKKVLLAISIGITCGVMVFITIWEIRDHITSKHLNAGFFEPNGLIPVYSIILVLILWIITNIASIFFNRLDKPERYSISGKFLLSFFRSYTTVLSKGFFIIIIFQVFFTVYFQFDLRLFVIIFVTSVILLFSFMEILNMIKQKREFKKDLEQE